jgi:hypothetical protein
MTEPELPPDISWITFESHGVTGLGRRRIVDGDGNVVQGPQPWRQELGVLTYNLFLVAASVLFMFALMVLVLTVLGMCAGAQ